MRFNRIIRRIKRQHCTNGTLLYSAGEVTFNKLFMKAHTHSSRHHCEINYNDLVKCLAEGPYHNKSVMEHFCIIHREPVGLCPVCVNQVSPRPESAIISDALQLQRHICTLVKSSNTSFGNTSLPTRLTSGAHSCPHIHPQCGLCKVTSFTFLFSTKYIRG